MINKVIWSEYNAAQVLEHPNLVKYCQFVGDATLTIHENGEPQSEACALFCMELVEKGDFFNLIMQSDHIDEATCKYFFTQILTAVHFMHENNVAHRDLKPQNCLLDSSFNIKIADFGFSCPLGGTNKSGFSQTKLGTPQYMAPELWISD